MGFLNIHFVAKYQKIEKGPGGDIEKFPKKKRKMRLWSNLIVPKNVTGHFVFLTSILSQNITKIKKRTFWRHKNFSKSLSAEQNSKGAFSLLQFCVTFKKGENEGRAFALT